MSVVIVTGGTFGIGRAISLTLAERGHNVVAFGLDSPQPSSTAAGGTAWVNAEATARDLPIVALEADVAKSADVTRVLATAIDRFGRVDALVNNAAIGPLGTILDQDEDLWDRIIDVNVKGTYLCCRAVLPHLIANGGGSIVNIGSGAGWGKPNMFAYATSKGAIFALSQSLAYDFFHAKIRVNTVIPGGGGIPTGMSIGRRAGSPDRSTGKATGTAAGRPATEQDIAGVVAFLLSPDATVMSGAIIDVGSFASQGGPVVDGSSFRRH
jgi:NAD(P)-dependent dehydrogenase (short-subunit alcohol dehydrogenase family)